jgi:hypothetical protein
MSGCQFYGWSIYQVGFDFFLALSSSLLAVRFQTRTTRNFTI